MRHTALEMAAIAPLIPSAVSIRSPESSGDQIGNDADPSSALATSGTADAAGQLSNTAPLRFPTPFLEGDYGVGDEPKTRKELAIVDLRAMIMNKERWYRRSLGRACCALTTSISFWSHSAATRHRSMGSPIVLNPGRLRFEKVFDEEICDKYRQEAARAGQKARGALSTRLRSMSTRLRSMLTRVSCRPSWRTRSMKFARSQRRPTRCHRCD